MTWLERLCFVWTLDFVWTPDTRLDDSRPAGRQHQNVDLYRHHLHHRHLHQCHRHHRSVVFLMTATVLQNFKISNLLAKTCLIETSGAAFHGDCLLTFVPR